MMQARFVIFATALAIVAYGSVHSHASAAAVVSDRAPIVWPGAPRTAASLSSKSEIFDEVPVSIPILASKDLRIRFGSFGPWERSAAPDSRFSILFQHHTNSKVRLGIAIFDDGEFLSNLRKPSWDAYVAGIRATQRDGLVSLTEAGSIDGGDGIMFLGQPTREVSYATVEAGSGKTGSHREFFAIVKGRLVALVVEGPHDSVAQLGTAIERFVGHLRVEE